MGLGDFLKNVFKGGGDFRPTTLASHRAMLHEAEQLDGHMAEMELAAKLFQHASECFLTTTSTFLAASPTPALYTQVDLTQPAQSHPAQQLPPQHQHLLSPQLQQQLGTQAPAAVARRIDKTLLRPLQLWRTALRAAQERLPQVEKLRVRYDQVRSKLEPLAADPGVASRNADRVDRLRAQLADLEAELEPAERQLYQLATWLVNDAARLKALLTHALGAAQAAAQAFSVPQALLEPFPLHTLGGEGWAQTAASPASPSSSLTSAEGEQQYQAAATAAAVTSPLAQQQQRQAAGRATAQPSGGSSASSALAAGAHADAPAAAPSLDQQQRSASVTLQMQHLPAGDATGGSGEASSTSTSLGGLLPGEVAAGYGGRRAPQLKVIEAAEVAYDGPMMIPIIPIITAAHSAGGQSGAPRGGDAVQGSGEVRRGRGAAGYAFEHVRSVQDGGMEPAGPAAAAAGGHSTGGGAQGAEVVGGGAGCASSSAEAGGEESDKVAEPHLEQAVAPGGTGLKGSSAATDVAGSEARGREQQYEWAPPAGLLASPEFQALKQRKAGRNY